MGPHRLVAYFLCQLSTYSAAAAAGVHGSGVPPSNQGCLVDDVSDVVQDVQSIEIGVITCSEEVPNWVDGPTHGEDECHSPEGEFCALRGCVSAFLGVASPNLVDDVEPGENPNDEHGHLWTLARLAEETGDEHHEGSAEEAPEQHRCGGTDSCEY